MKHNLTLFFKRDLITDIMDRCDLSEGSHKVFCELFDITIDACDNWFLSPAVVNVLEESFLSKIITKISAEEENLLCGIYDATNEVFYNFTDPRKQITMFSNGQYFAYFDTKQDVKKDNYQKAYKYFIFNDKQSDNERFVCNIAEWLTLNGEKDEDCK